MSKALKNIKEHRLLAKELKEKDMVRVSQMSEYIKIDRQLKENLLQLCKALALDQDTSFYDQREVVLRKQMDQFLKEQGITDGKYFNCCKCMDTGQLPSGQKCTCLINEYNKLLREHNGLNCLNKDWTFNNKNIQDINCKQQEKISKLLVSLERFCHDFPNTKYRNMFILGSVGVGKSFLLSCMVNELFKNNVDVIYLNATTLSDTLLQYHTTDVKYREKCIKELMDCEVLCIDDLGTEPILKNITMEYLYKIIEQRKYKHTIVTSNLTLQELHLRYGERTISRLISDDSLTLLILGDDLRHINKKQGKQ